jgi:hypothetical protein
VRRAQLALVSDQIDRLESAIDGVPTVQECLEESEDGRAKIPDALLASRYVELRERVDVLLGSLKRLHFRTCGRYAWELRRYMEN